MKKALFILAVFITSCSVGEDPNPRVSELEVNGETYQLEVSSLNPTNTSNRPFTSIEEVKKALGIFSKEIKEKGVIRVNKNSSEKAIAGANMRNGVHTIYSFIDDTDWMMNENYDYDALTSFIFNGRRSSQLLIDVAYEWCMNSASWGDDSYPFFTKVNSISFLQTGAQGTTVRELSGSNNTKISGAFRQNIILDLEYRCHFEMTVSYEVALSLNINVANLGISYGGTVPITATREREPINQTININDALAADGITNPQEYADCFDDPSDWDNQDAGGGGASGDTGDSGYNSGENGDVIIIIVEVEPKEIGDEETEEPDEEETPPSNDGPVIA